MKKMAAAKVPLAHPFVGTWEQEEPDSGQRTTISYTVEVKEGKFAVSGRDEANGTALKISQVRWGGDSLQFNSFYAPGEHRAKHALKLRSKRKMSHKVSGTYFDGETFSALEVWIKRRSI
jgi:hypothetical protein